MQKFWMSSGYFTEKEGINSPSDKMTPQLISADLISKAIYENIEGALEMLKSNTNCKTFSSAEKKLNRGDLDDPDMVTSLRADCAVLYTMLTMLDGLKLEDKYRKKRIDKEAWKWAYGITFD